MANWQHLHINVQTAMEHRGLDVGALAASAGLKPENLQRLLAGKKRPTDSDCERLAAALGIVSPDLDRRPSQFRLRLGAGTLGLQARDVAAVREVAAARDVANNSDGDEHAEARPQSSGRGETDAAPEEDWDARRKLRRRQMAQRVAAGDCTLEQVAHEFGVSVLLVRQACRGHGVELRHRSSAAQRARRSAEIAQHVTTTGCTAEQAAMDLGASLKRVLQACKLHQVAVYKDAAQLARAERKREVVQWIVAQSATYAEAVAHFNESFRFVRQACRASGVRAKRPERLRGSLQLQVLALLIEGVPQSHAAALLGVSRQYVSQCAHNATAAGLFDAVEKAASAAVARS